MSTNIFYTPIVKGKANDLKALGRIAASTAASVSPLVELLAPNHGDDIGRYFVRFASQLKNFCPTLTCSLDMHSIAPGRRTGDDEPALEALCDYLRGIGVHSIPVFGFDHEPELWPRIARLAKSGHNGLTVRLRQDDVEAGDETAEELVNWLRDVKLPASTTKIVIDLGSLTDVDASGTGRLRDRSQDLVERLMSLANFELVSIVASSMPKDVADVPRNGERSFRRREVGLWLDMRDNIADLAFGDYGVVHPNFSDKNPATNANAKIRYTSGLDHHIFRGYSLRQHLKYKQYHGLAARVAASSFYQGRTYSYGDDYVWNCAREAVGTGSLGTWVEVDMSHHFAHVTAQIPQMMHRLAGGMKGHEVVESMT